MRTRRELARVTLEINQLGKVPEESPYRLRRAYCKTSTRVAPLNKSHSQPNDAISCFLKGECQPPSCSGGKVPTLKRRVERVLPHLYPLFWVAGSQSRPCSMSTMTRDITMARSAGLEPQPFDPKTRHVRICSALESSQSVTARLRQCRRDTQCR